MLSQVQMILVFTVEWSDHLTTSSILLKFFPSLLGHTSTQMSSFWEKSASPSTLMEILSASSGLTSLFRVAGLSVQCLGFGVHKFAVLSLFFVSGFGLLLQGREIAVHSSGFRGECL